MLSQTSYLRAASRMVSDFLIKRSSWAVSTWGPSVTITPIGSEPSISALANCPLFLGFQNVWKLACPLLGEARHGPGHLLYCSKAWPRYLLYFQAWHQPSCFLGQMPDGLGTATSMHPSHPLEGPRPAKLQTLLPSFPNRRQQRQVFSDFSVLRELHTEGWVLLFLSFSIIFLFFCSCALYNF